MSPWNVKHIYLMTVVLHIIASCHISWYQRFSDASKFFFQIFFADAYFFAIRILILEHFSFIFSFVLNYFKQWKLDVTDVIVLRLLLTAKAGNQFKDIQPHIILTSASNVDLCIFCYIQFILVQFPNCVCWCQKKLCHFELSTYHLSCYWLALLQNMLWISDNFAPLRIHVHCLEVELFIEI